MKTSMSSGQRARFVLWGVFMSGAIFLLIVMAFLTHGQAFIDQMYSKSTDTFYDFTVSVISARDPAEYGGMYPPLAQLIFHLIANLLPPEYDSYTLYDLINSPLGAIYVLYYFLFFLMAYFAVIKKVLHVPQRIQFFFVFSTLLSVPFIYGLQRGNIIFVCLPLMLFFVEYYDSQNPKIQILAMGALAIAAGIKLYPAMLGLLLVKKRMWKQTGVCVLLGLLAVILPAMYYDGANTIFLVAQRLMSTTVAYDDRGFGHQLGFKNFIDILNAAWHTQISADIMFIVLVIVMFANILICKVKWRLLVILCAAMVLWPGFSTNYAMIMMIVPLVYFLNYRSSFTWWDILYAILFASCFIPIPFGGHNAFPFSEGQYYMLNVSTLVENIAINILLLLVTVQNVFDFIRAKRSPRQP